MTAGVMPPFRCPTWPRFVAAYVDEWGLPVSNRVRLAVLLIVCTVWLAVCGVSVLKGELPGAELIGVPIAAVIALGRRGGGGENGKDEDGDSET